MGQCSRPGRIGGLGIQASDPLPTTYIGDQPHRQGDQQHQTDAEQPPAAALPVVDRLHRSQEQINTHCGTAVNRSEAVVMVSEAGARRARMTASSTRTKR